MSRHSNHELPDLLDSDLELLEPDPDTGLPPVDPTGTVLPRSGRRLPPNVTVVNPRSLLVHPDRDRRYEFTVFGVNEVRVRKWEGGRLTENKEVTREAARKLWRWLLKIGYHNPEGS